MAMRNVGHPSLFIFTYGKISSSVSKYKASAPREFIAYPFLQFSPLTINAFLFLPLPPRNEINTRILFTRTFLNFSRIFIPPSLVLAATRYQGYII